MDITDDDVEGYLARIGCVRTDAPERLMAAHLRAVPFENRSVHRRDPIRLDARSLIDKVCTARRGGFCYELNGGGSTISCRSPGGTRPLRRRRSAGP